jgi:hypothetical protein
MVIYYVINEFPIGSQCFHNSPIHYPIILCWKILLFVIDDETLPNFIKGKPPKKGREKETRGQGPKSRQINSLKIWW